MANQRDYRRRDDYDPPRRPANRRPPRRAEEGEWERPRTRDRPRYEEFDNPRSERERSDRDYERSRPYREPPNREKRYNDSYNDRGSRPVRRYPNQERNYPPQNYGRPRQQGYPRQGAKPYPSNQLKQARDSTYKKAFLFVYNLVFYTVMIGIILSAVMFSFSEKSNAAIMGYRFYQVLTDSMAPSEGAAKGGFYSGDIVIVKMMDGSKVKEGDIVTFQVGEGDRYLTHRMVERLDELNGEKGDYIVTKGDANQSADPPISAEKVFGKVTFVIPKMGSFLAFVRENPWLCLVCVLSTFGFFLVLKAYFLQPDKKAPPSYPRRV